MIVSQMFDHMYMSYTKLKFCVQRIRTWDVARDLGVIPSLTDEWTNADVYSMRWTHFQVTLRGIILKHGGAKRDTEGQKGTRRDIGRHGGTRRDTAGHEWTRRGTEGHRGTLGDHPALGGRTDTGRDRLDKSLGGHRPGLIGQVTRRTDTGRDWLDKSFGGRTPN